MTRSGERSTCPTANKYGHDAQLPELRMVSDDFVALEFEFDSRCLFLSTS